MTLLLVPCLALGFSAVGFVEMTLREGAAGSLRGMVESVFWAGCSGSGAVALFLIATGRSA